MKKIISLFLCVGILLPIVACSKKEAMTWQEQYDLGVRYLSEGNYKEAIIAFEAAIAIDPQQADGYVRLAEAYIQINDFENATRVVNQGIDACGESDAFTLLLTQIHISELLQNGMTDNMIQREEINFFGHNIETLSFQESIEIIQQRGYESFGDHSADNGDFISVLMANDDVIIDVTEYSDKKVMNWGYTFKSSNKYPIDIRNISAYDSIADVLTKLGFSNGQEISAYIMDIANSEISAALLDSDGSYRALIQKYLYDGCTFILSIIPGFISISIDFDTDYGQYFGKYSVLGFNFGYGYQDSLTGVGLTYTDIPESTTYD